jgi:hypothetical protein
MVFKKHLTPIGRGGIVKHAGKGSSQATLPNRRALTQLQTNPNATINDYSKATPPAPAGQPMADNLATGDSPGIGI